MLKTKVIGILSAFALAFALPMTAFADDWSIAGNNLDLEGISINGSGSQCSITVDYAGAYGDDLHNSFTVTGPASAVGANVTSVLDWGETTELPAGVMQDNGNGQSSCTIPVNEDIGCTLRVTVSGAPSSDNSNSDDVATAPVAGGTTDDNTTPDSATTDNGSVAASDNEPSSDGATTSKISPKTGFSSEFVVLGTISSLIAAAGVMIVLRRKANSAK